jgi:uncharacterized Zn-finger protein
MAAGRQGLQQHNPASPTSRKQNKTPKVALQLAVSATPTADGSGGQRLKRITNTDNVFTLHKTDEGIEKFRCKACHRCFNLKCTLLRHVRHQHQGRFVPHPCPQCGQVFKRTDHLKVHLKKIHQIEAVSSRQQARMAAEEAAIAAGEGEGEENMVESPMAIGEIADSPLGIEEGEEEEAQ